MKNNNLKKTLLTVEEIIREIRKHGDKVFLHSDDWIDIQFDIIKEELFSYFLKNRYSFDKCLLYLQLEIQHLLDMGTLVDEVLSLETLNSPLLNAFKSRSINLLDSLQKDYCSVFRLDFRAPAAYVQHKAEEWRKLISMLNHSLSIAAIDKPLAELLTNYLYDFFDKKDLTYYQINTFQYRIELLNDFLEDSNELELNQKLCFVLIKEGFKEEHFVAYVVNFIRNQPIESKATLDIFLNDWRLAVWSIKKDEILNHHKIDLIQVLEQALKEKERQELIRLNEAKESKEITPYFHANTNLVQLLYFFQLMIEVDFIECKNRTEVFKFISDHIETDRVSHPSLGSMQRKFGTANKADKIKIKNILIKMLNQVNQEKFN